MMEYRHCAYNIHTGELINSNHGNHLKREVARTKRFDKEYYNAPGVWRFSHDYGKNWEVNGFPKR